MTITSLIYLVGFIGNGLVLLVSEIYSLKMYRSVKDWPRAEAVIIDKELTKNIINIE